jgi:hypothetical protein
MALFAAVGMAGCGSDQAGTTTPGGVDSGRGAAGGSGHGGSSSTHDGGLGGIIVVDPPPMDAGTGEDCRRDVSLTAVTLGEPEPFDLIIVADHSQSLAWSRDELSAGLQRLLADVQGRTVRIFLLTPTQYGASSANAQQPLTGESVVAWQDLATGKPYTNAMTTYTQSCTNPASGAPMVCPSSKGPDPYREQGTWQFAMPDPIGLITPDQSDAEFAAEQKAVADKILAIGGTGSPQEQPLCTLSRYVSQDPTLLPKNAVFLIISDEDDVSTPAQCLAGFTATLTSTKNEAGSSPCSTGCDTYRYTMTGDSYWTNFAIQCRGFDDLGNPIPGTDKPNSVSQSRDGACSAGPCTPEESKVAAPFCDKGLTLVSCDRTCTTGETSCTVDLPDATVDPCKQSFSTAGGQYANLAAYCGTRGYSGGWRDCKGGGLDLQYTDSLSGSFAPTRVMTGSTTADIASYFRGQANAVFPQNGYLVEAIVLDPAFSCKLGAGQSYAKNLVAMVGDRSHVFSLCDTYAPALNSVLSFAQALITTEFPLALKSDERVTFVHVIGKNGSERTLTAAQYHYDPMKQVLTVDRSSIGATDSTLRVEVTSDCRPIIK